MRPTSKFLQECSITAQYTMSGTRERNVVANSHNNIVKDIVRSVLRNSTSPTRLSAEALKMVIHNLDSVPSKVIPKTPYMNYGFAVNSKAFTYFVSLMRSSISN